MYSGSYSAVVDLSKFFHNFPTHPNDRPFLGVIHPITGVLYTYWGLSMGAGKSPALAGRFGLAFVRLLQEKFHEFQGQPDANCWWTSFTYDGFDAAVGFGYTLKDVSSFETLLRHRSGLWLFVPPEEMYMATTRGQVSLLYF